MYKRQVLVEFGAKVTVVAPEAGSGVQVNHAAELKSFTAVGDSVLEQYAQPDKCAAGEKSPWECRTILVRKLAEAGRLAVSYTHLVFRGDEA